MPPEHAASSPLYQPIEWDHSGALHILFAGASDDALTRRLLRSAPPPVLVLIRVRTDADADDAERWQRLLPASGRSLLARDLDDALQQLHDTLDTAPMGARLYIFGSEDVLWRASRVAQLFAMAASQIRQQRVATLARPVYCVHCRAMNSGVRTNLVACTGCARVLHVRDHFSRRLGAYMGCQADAEAPGELPAIAHCYP